MKYAIGLMSGSSMDGIDGALICTDGKNYIDTINYISYDYLPRFKSLLRAAEFGAQKAKGILGNISNYDISSFLQIHSPDVPPVSIESIIKELTLLHNQVIQKLLIDANLKASQIDVIGFHGQNLFHDPKNHITLQIGDGEFLANTCNIKTVYDFRSKDVQSGGQGAPFAPIYHLALANKLATYPIIFVNCGGIANISYIHSTDIKDIIAFDCGPGNVLIDRLVRKRTNGKEFMDKDGKYGENGKVDTTLLEALKNEIFVGFDRPFLDIHPPKSLDTGNFKLPQSIENLSLEDACANLEALTATCITQSLKFLPHIPKLWVLAGGGWNNPVIVEQLKVHIQEIAPSSKITNANDIGLNGKYMEAELFGYLAVRTLSGLPISFPNTTGVAAPCIGGKVAIPTT